jgi:hypothetical protein
MINIINEDRIKIYRHYKGDIEGILKTNKKADLEKFGSDLDGIWSKITSVLQDIESVEKGLASKEYTEKILVEIKALCDNAAYEELTKVISIDRFSLIDIIKDYQISANQAVNVFKVKYKVNDILEGWHNKVYEQTGKLIDEGLYFYAFHGIGLAAHFKDKIVDFDFAYFPKPRHDGFDLWRLKNFIQNQRNKYPNYRDATKVEKEFNNLIKGGVIVKPKLIDSTSLYFFKNTLKTETIDATEGKVEHKNSLRKSFQSWLKKISNR